MAGFFGFFDYSKPGRGVSKDEPQKTGPALYFDILLRRFWKLISLNLIYVIASLPAIAISWFMSSFAITYLASFNMDFSKLSADESQALLLLSMLLTIIIPAVFGTGPATAAMSYVLRNYVNDTHAWVLGDFKDHFKSNFKQGLIVYLIDTVVICLFAISIFFYSVQMGGSLVSLALRAIVFAVFIVFALMHLYIYPVMATFKLSIKNIYRNSLLLAMAKLPWSVLTAAVVGLLIYGAIYLVISSGLGIFAIILLYFSLVNFTSIFMTNGVVRKFLLEPSLAQQNEGKTDIDTFNEDDVVFEDVTERRSKRG